MKTIDLVFYADRSKKIPSKILSPEIIERPSSWRILFAHAIDFYFVLLIGSLTSVMYSQSIKMFLVTRSLRLAYSEQALLSFSTSFLPLLTLSYFSFCYFMNHGQTLGMTYVKSRIQMQDKNFYESLKWAMTSVFLCFSLGLSYFMTRDLWARFKWRDYLYQDLVAYKEEMGIDLLARTNLNSEEIAEKEHTKIAA